MNPLPKWVQPIPPDLTLDQLRLVYVLHVLHHCEGNRAQAASVLGMTALQLRRLIAKPHGYYVHPARQRAKPTKNSYSLMDPESLGDCARNSKCKLPDKCSASRGCEADRLIMGRNR